MEYITTDHEVFSRAIHLYDRVCFGNVTTKYICWYKDNRRLNCIEEPDMSADCIFEKSVNPHDVSECYVCVKCGNEYRENLAK